MKLQQAIQPVVKELENEGFKRGGVPSKYADLSACVEATREPMLKTGFAFSQDVTCSEGGVGVSTTLLHESGDSMTSRPCWLPVPNKTPQGFGSAITYARRYSFCAYLGIVTEDDDGNAASSKLPKPSGTEGLAEKAKSASRTGPVSNSPEARNEPATHDRNLVLLFNNAEKKPLHSLAVKDLQWFATALAKNVDDPAKANFREANAKALNAVRLELAYRGIA